MNKAIDLLNNKYVVAFMAIFLASYGTRLGGQNMPDWLRKLFENNIFRVVFLSLLLIYNFNKSPHVAVIIGMVFVLTMFYLNQKEVEENFEYLETYEQMTNH